MALFYIAICAMYQYFYDAIIQLKQENGGVYMTKKILMYVAAVGVVLAIFLIGGFLLFNNSGDGFNYDSTDIISAPNTTDEDFFVPKNDLTGYSVNLTEKLNKQLTASFNTNLELGDFAHFYTYYIPQQMNYMVAAYHYENLNSDIFQPYNSWSPEYYENSFMAVSGQYLYYPFVLALTENTLEYGFIPMNQVVHDSPQFTILAMKYLPLAYN